MSKISRETVAYVAGLAQLELDEGLMDQMVADLDKIVTYIDKLNELDTEGVAPMMHALDDLVNVYREDEVGESLPRETVMENAPSTDGEFFLVPKILEQVEP